MSQFSIIVELLSSFLSEDLLFLHVFSMYETESTSMSPFLPET